MKPNCSINMPCWHSGEELMGSLSLRNLMLAFDEDFSHEFGSSLQYNYPRTTRSWATI